jgi:hypothetical protein
MFSNPLALLANPLSLIPLALIVICVVHAVKRGNVFPWIYIIIFLPAIGSLIYIGMEIIPELMRSRSARNLASGAKAVADPNRSFREAQRNAELSGSVDARRRLADEHIKRGEYGEAVALYKSMLVGQFAEDTTLLHGYARAQFASGDAAGAQATLDELQRVDPKFSSADAHLLYARALEKQGKNGEAIEEYKRLVRYFSGEEARARYAALLEKTGAHESAREVYDEIVRSLENAAPRYRAAQREWGEFARRAVRA